MKYIVDSTKPVTETVEALKEAVARHQFGVLNVQDLQATLKGKGFDLDNGCVVLDICNPKQAMNVLNQDMAMSLALPCRVAVFSESGRTHIGMISPESMLGALSDDPSLKQVAVDVEDALKQMINEAAG